MPLTFAIRVDGIDSTEGENPRVVVTYTGSGSSDYDTVVAGFAAVVSATWGSLPLVNRQVRATENVELWECIATYAYPTAQNAASPPDVGDSSFSFDTTGGTTGLKHNLAHVASFAAAGKTATDYQGAINVDADGNVEGTDIISPVYAWSETHQISPLLVTNTYKGLLFRLTGRINDAAFKGLARGECLFLGASGSLKGSTQWEIQFRFAAQPNITGATFGATTGYAGVTGVTKMGWDYIWPEFDRIEDDNNNRMSRRLRAVHVERVYEFGNFGLLGIGTT